MKLGISVSSGHTVFKTSQGDADYALRVALAVEEAGFDSVWVADRTVYPADLATRYSDRFGPGRSDPNGQNVLEAHTTLTFLAGATRRVRLGYSVLVLPFRNPVLNAKMVTTLDVLSGGRVIFGVGVGWMPEEFEGMGASYSDRGALTNEHMEMFKTLCTQDVAEYRGQHFGISGMTFFPKPVQQPHPPIWVGGRSNLALRRAARLGDGWIGNVSAPEQLSERVAALRRICQRLGRNPDSVTVANCLGVQLGEPRRAQNGERALLTGNAAAVLGDLRSFQDAGMEYAVLSVTGKDTDSAIADVRRLADEVLPKA